MRKYQNNRTQYLEGYYLHFLVLNIAKFGGLIIITMPSAIIAYISVVKSHENRNTVPITEIIKPVCYKQGRIYYTKSRSTAIDTKSTRTTA